MLNALHVLAGRKQEFLLRGLQLELSESSFKQARK